MDNSIQLYPSTSQQYINNAWQAITTAIYQNGEWIDLWNGELYMLGDEYNNVTGGWDVYCSGGLGTINKGLDSITVSKSGVAAGTTSAVPVNSIDLTQFKTLKFNITNNYASSNSSNSRNRIYVCPDLDVRHNVASLTPAHGATGAMSIDVSDLIGSYYILFAVYTFNSDFSGSLTFNKVWLE